MLSHGTDPRVLPLLSQVQQSECTKQLRKTDGAGVYTLFQDRSTSGSDSLNRERGS